jgi:SAM-dependent methyltransferase
VNKISLLSHNWLALKINNKSLKDNLQFIQGCVVDLGCGSSPYKEDILKVASSYIGVDWIITVHDQSGIDVFADICRPFPFKNSSIDTVVSFQVLEHLENPDFFLSECFRVLKKGGHLFLTVPFMWYIHEAPHDYYRFTKYGLQYLLKKNNFSDAIVKENTGFWQMWCLKFNYHTTCFAKGILKFFFIPIWWLTQIISPMLDICNRNIQETASYTVLARKN